MVINDSSPCFVLPSLIPRTVLSTITLLRPSFLTLLRPTKVFSLQFLPSRNPFVNLSNPFCFQLPFFVWFIVNPTVISYSTTAHDSLAEITFCVPQEHLLPFMTTHSVPCFIYIFFTDKSYRKDRVVRYKFVL